MAGVRVSRRRARREREVAGAGAGAGAGTGADAEVAKRAASALVAADERIRMAVDELGFAEAELGSDATEGLRQALVSARALLGEAFRLHRADHHPLAGAPGEPLARNVRIVASCDRVASMLDEQLAALADAIAVARRVPETIVAVRGGAAHLRTRLVPARKTIDQLAMRYGRATLELIESKPAQAEQLLRFAEHSVRVAERRRDAGDHHLSNVALEASVEAVRRASDLLNAVEGFDVDALRAESEVASMVDAAHRKLAVAREHPQSHLVDDAMALLEAALAEVQPIGVITDPFVQRDRLRQANARLDAALRTGGRRPMSPVRPALATHPTLATHPAHPAHPAHSTPLGGHLQQAVGRALRRLDAARDVVAGSPGRIGPEALTRLAEAEHLRFELGCLLGGSSAIVSVVGADVRAHAIATAATVLDLANDALRLARLDVEASRRGVQVAVAAL